MTNALCVYSGMESIISLWPTLSDLASDLRKPYSTVNAWKQRGHIPAKFDLDLIDAANKRGAVLTLEQLAVARRESAV